MSVINNQELILAIKTKKLNTRLSLRSSANNIGISPATLSRIKNGANPDLYNYFHICKWLGVKIETFFNKY